MLVYGFISFLIVTLAALGFQFFRFYGSHMKTRRNIGLGD